MKAYWRDDLEEEGLMPACSEPVSLQEWLDLDFKIIDTAIFETTEGFNMILEHPKTGRFLFVCSIDFNYKH